MQKRNCKYCYGLFWLMMFVLSFTVTDNAAGNTGNVNATTYLGLIMDQYHTTYDVYTDADAAGNHFASRGRMSSQGNEDAVLPMDESFKGNPRSGINSIKAEFRSRGSNWGGWYFMNGVLHGDEHAPGENWGYYPNSGVNLSGATRLTFWARGSRGGERVEFFAFGIGREPSGGVPTMPFPDSSPKSTTEYVTLSTDWAPFIIDVVGKDLSYVLGGFAWVTSASENNNQDIIFYIDDIKYEKARLDEPRFMVSYGTINSSSDFDVILRNVAFTYDNAVALMALLAAGDKHRAKLIADGLVYAMHHDRFYDDGRIRNAYQAGDLRLPPGWTPNGKNDTVRMPGWYNKSTQQWLEDRFQVSTHTGNVAWAMLALLAYYESEGGEEYLMAVEHMGDWVEINTRDSRGAGGYTGGFEGWEPNPARLSYKSTEHNIDLYAAFQRIFLITGNATWHERANHAKQFILSMWDDQEGKFWTGTDNSGVAANRDVIPVDIQAWALLSLKEEGKQYWRALDYAADHHKVGNGFDFNQDQDGVWYEGTAQMAVAYYYTGQIAKGQALLGFLKSAQLQSGGIPAARHDGLTTGFYLPDGQPWLYFNRTHVGASAWLALAEKNVNPFWMGSKTSGTVAKIPDTAVRNNATVTLPIMVDNVSGITSANILLAYDPVIVDVINVSAANLNASFTAVIDNVSGVLNISARSDAGKNGSIVYANIILKALGTAGTTSPLVLIVRSLSDGNEIPINYTTRNGMFNVGTALRGDANGDGRIDRNEAVRAVIDYFNGIRSRDEAIGVVMEYFRTGS